MRRLLSTAASVAIVAAILYLLYGMIIEPYSVQPKKDILFLSTMPTKDEIIQRFGTPTEQIGPGQKFTMTGWHPLPKDAAADMGLAFQRPNADKIYIFFSRDGRLLYYVVSHS